MFCFLFLFLLLLLLLTKSLTHNLQVNDHCIESIWSFIFNLDCLCNAIRKDFAIF